MVMRMSDKELEEARRSNIPLDIVSKMIKGLELTKGEMEIVRQHGKVFVPGYFKKVRGEFVYVRSQLRDLPSGKVSMKGLRVVATPSINEVKVNGKSTTYFKKFNDKVYSYNSSYYSKKDAIEFVKRRKEITGYDNRIVKFADRYLVYTGK